MQIKVNVGERVSGGDLGSSDAECHFIPTVVLVPCRLNSIKSYSTLHDKLTNYCNIDQMILYEKYEKESQLTLIHLGGHVVTDQNGGLRVD